jgi:two-component system NtrC family sensor kinase
MVKEIRTDAAGREAARLRALHRYGMLDTVADPALDELTGLAARLCQAPIALIALLDANRVWFKSRVGLTLPQVPRSPSFSDRLVQDPTPCFVIADTLEDPDWAQHPLIQQDPPIRFYAGVPLNTPDGYVIGALCVMGYQPRTLSEEQREVLVVFSHQVVAQFELRLSVINLERTMSWRRRIERSLHTKNQQFRKTLHDLHQTQAQLVQTEKMSSLGQMLAGVAHEINNPVSFVYGNLAYISRYAQDLFRLLDLYQKHHPEPPPEIQQAMDEMDLNFVQIDLPRLISSMKVGADRIRQIVLSLRNFSRTDDTQMTEFNLHEGLDSTLMILEHRLKPSPQFRGIEVVKDYGELPPVKCYAGQMNQVFMNILSNAIDALEQMGSDPDYRDRPPKIILRTRPIPAADPEAPPRAIAVYILDNGLGMPSRVRDHIFDPFFTTKAVGKGTGLGLAISYQVVVERHNGVLKCQSQEGKGTAFYIEIPAPS